MINQLTIGLALSGGSVRGFAHLGVLKVIEEEKIKISYISGTSIGAIIGSLYCAGYSVKEIISTARRINFQSLFQLPFGVSGISSSEPIEKLIKRLIPHDRFDKLEIPLKITVTNFSKGQPVIFDSGSLSRSVRMSASFPGVYSPVLMDNDLYGDGGIYNNFPVRLVKEMGADIVIGVDVLPRADLRRKNYNLMEILDHCLDLLLLQQTMQSGCDLLLEPVTQMIHSLDMGKRDALIEMGEKAAREKLLPFMAAHQEKISAENIALSEL